jgi:hypothetical protein
MCARSIRGFQAPTGHRDDHGSFWAADVCSASEGPPGERSSVWRSLLRDSAMSILSLLLAFFASGTLISV